MGNCCVAENSLRLNQALEKEFEADDKLDQRKRRFYYAVEESISQSEDNFSREFPTFHEIPDPYFGSTSKEASTKHLFKESKTISTRNQENSLHSVVIQQTTHSSTHTPKPSSPRPSLILPFRKQITSKILETNEAPNQGKREPHPAVPRRSKRHASLLRYQAQANPDRSLPLDPPELPTISAGFASNTLPLSIGSLPRPSAFAESSLRSLPRLLFDLPSQDSRCYLFSDQSCYCGDLLYSLKHGLGTEVTLNGSVYEGHFRNNRRDGQGRLVKSNGAVYEGEWHNGLRHGPGLWIDPQKNEWFEGMWDLDRMHGHGNMRKQDGTRAQGNWKVGEMHGWGKLWKDTQQHNSTQAYVEGLFIMGMLSGKGKELTDNGAVYEGEFRNGKWEGKGVLREADQVYEGEFGNGMRNGWGKQKW